MVDPSNSFAASAAQAMAFQPKTYVISFLSILAIFLFYTTPLSYPAGLSVDTFAGEVTTLPTEFKKQKSKSHAFHGKNVAVIIEDRRLTNLAPLILHFSSVLGPGWPIILFTSQDITPTSAAFQCAINSSRVSIQFLPPDVHFTNHGSVTEFLTAPWLWEKLAPAEHVFFFQADSIICANSPLHLDDFLNYDFIGAPIDPKYGQGYNGGLSLRNRSMILDIVQKHSWREEREEAIENDEVNPSVTFEDQWFYKKMKELPDFEDGRPGARLPDLEAAANFSVETVWSKRPFGFHQVARWQEKHIKEVDEWCPEHRIATNDLIVTHGHG